MCSMLLVWPSTAQFNAVQRSLGHSAASCRTIQLLVQCSAVQCHKVCFCVARLRSAVWYTIAAWPGIVWFGLVWFGQVGSGQASLGLVWLRNAALHFAMIRCTKLRRATLSYAMPRHATQHRALPNNVAWHGAALYRTPQCGAV